MTNNVIKKLINEELNRFNGKLYVFDFDETLVSDSALAYIIKPDGTKISINHHDYKTYELQPGDRIDISEFETVNNPIVNKPIMDLLKSVQNNAIILTARTADVPVSDFLKTQGINVPVFAVGTKDPALICSAYNAKRKSEWLTNAIQTFKITEIEFWDDNKMNIYAVDQLGNTLPVKVKTNLVKFNPS